MRDLYIKPQVEFKEFDILDVVKCSPPAPEDPTAKPGEGSGDNNDPDWSHLY